MNIHISKIFVSDLFSISNAVYRTIQSFDKRIRLKIIPIESR